MNMMCQIEMQSFEAIIYISMSNVSLVPWHGWVPGLATRYLDTMASIIQVDCDNLT